MVRPVKRRVRLFGFGVVLAGRYLVRRLRGRVSDQVGVVAGVGLDFFSGGRGDYGEVGGLIEQSAHQARGSFNASDGGDSADRVGSSADHESVGDCGDAYSLQNGGSIEHAADGRLLKKHEE